MVPLVMAGRACVCADACFVGKGIQAVMGLTKVVHACVESGACDSSLLWRPQLQLCCMRCSIAVQS
jgi:hypothetical protein